MTTRICRRGLMSGRPAHHQASASPPPASRTTRKWALWIACCISTAGSRGPRYPRRLAAVRARLVEGQALPASFPAARNLLADGGQDPQAAAPRAGPFDSLLLSRFSAQVGVGGIR